VTPLFSGWPKASLATKSQEMLDRIKTLIDGSQSTAEKLQAVCRLIKDSAAHYDWVGFYLVAESGGELVLGPYEGEPTEHVRIPFGRGICGQAAASGETFLVQDVAKEPNYLSCSPAVRSEVVVPIFKSARLVGELDIDSHTPAAFTDAEVALLEQICQIVATLL